MSAAPQVFETELLFRPPTPELRFLPEGPRAVSAGQLSWVAIQHGADATTGSLNLLDYGTGTNTTFPLRGRPGFAVPTSSNSIFLVGMERELVLYDISDDSYHQLDGDLERGVEGTIINDGELFAEGLVFGAKDLKFTDKKAGLYLLRQRDRQLFTLRQDQICSNGKVLLGHEGGWRLLNICSPCKMVVEYELNVEQGSVVEVRTAIDLTSGSAFPDGMVVTPDGKSVIIAFYNPEPAPFGEARQYSIATGATEAIWRTPGSPQVTCPRLVSHEGKVRLVLTTAIEHMTAERQAEAPQAGCLFWGETAFTELAEEVRFSLEVAGSQ
jgi:sugar lactone lactonase YvrE